MNSLSNMNLEELEARLVQCKVREIALLVGTTAPEDLAAGFSSLGVSSDG